MKDPVVGCRKTDQRYRYLLLIFVASLDRVFFYVFKHYREVYFRVQLFDPAALYIFPCSKTNGLT